MLTRRAGLGVAVLAAGLALAASAPSASADVGVSGLRVGTDREVRDPRIAFPAGTRVIYARFDYAEATGHRISLNVTAYGGVVVHQYSRRYDGDGTDVTEIDGDGVLGHLTAELAGSAQSARSSARQAASQQFGVLEYLNGVQAGVVRMGNVVDVVATVRASELSADKLAELRRIETQVSDLVTRAMRAADDDQRRQMAQRMAQPLDRAVVLAGELDVAATAATNVPLPVSGSAWQYVVRATVDGSPADSAEFVIDGGRVLLPSLSRRAPLHR